MATSSKLDSAFCSSPSLYHNSTTDYRCHRPTPSGCSAGENAWDYANSDGDSDKENKIISPIAEHERYLEKRLLSPIGLFVPPLPSESYARSGPVGRLINCEFNFFKKIQQGKLHYSAPLRHMILKHEQHSALFLNIEKLGQLSNFIYNQLKSLIDTHSSSPEIAKIYTNCSTTLKESYEFYFKNISSALSVYSKLCKKKVFKEFLTVSVSF